ncbi:MAG: acetate permease, partial [Bacteroidetes bacterium]|nr:acetate permease [Bacteroidota bacterium]
IEGRVRGPTGRAHSARAISKVERRAEPSARPKLYRGTGRWRSGEAAKRRSGEAAKRGSGEAGKRRSGEAAKRRSGEAAKRGGGEMRTL